MKRNIVISLILVILESFLSSCVNISGLYQDPSFTHKSVISDHIGVGGVTSTVNRLTHTQQMVYADLLSNVLIQKYPRLDVMPAGDAVRALGASRYQTMMNFYRQNGVVPEDDLIQLKNHIHRMRYLVFARITSENVEQRHQINEESNEEQYITSLNIITELTVYDLISRQIVWSGSRHKGSANSNDYYLSIYHSSNKNFLIALGEEIVGNIVNASMDAAIDHYTHRHYEYPAAPCRDNLLSIIFDEFMVKFP